MKLFIVMLVLTGSMAMHKDHNQFGRGGKHMFRRTTESVGRIESQQLTSSTFIPTTDDPCYSCRNIPISITDTSAGQCFAYGEGATCDCMCADVFCYNNEVIDRSTCVPNGRLQDCKCISSSTVVTSTTDPFAGCESCLDRKLTVGDTFAGQCFPYTLYGECSCICADVFCNNGQVIDRSTCVSGGSINDCKCIDVSTVPSSTFTSIPFALKRKI